MKFSKFPKAKLRYGSGKKNKKQYLAMAAESIPHGDDNNLDTGIAMYIRNGEVISTNAYENVKGFYYEYDSKHKVWQCNQPSVRNMKQSIICKSVRAFRRRLKKSPIGLRFVLVSRRGADIIGYGTAPIDFNMFWLLGGIKAYGQGFEEELKGSAINPTDLPPLLAKAATLGRIDAFCGDDVKNIDYKHNPKEIYDNLFY